MNASSYSLTLTKEINTDIDTVFTAWVTEAALKEWCGPEGYEITYYKSRFEATSPWASSIRSPQGTIHKPSGVYHVVTKPHKLILTHHWEEEDGKISPETLLTVEFSAKGHSTFIKFTQSGLPSEEEKKAHLTGWESSFKRLAEYLRTKSHK